MILYGWARGGHEHIGNAKPSRIGWILFLPLTWVALQWFFTPTRPATYLVVGIMLGPPVYQILRRQNNAHPGLVQVRFTARGFVQYDDLAGPSVIRDMFRFNGWLIPIAAAIMIVFAWRHGNIEPIQFWIWLPLAAGAEVLLWRSSQRFRRAMRDVREGSIADRNAAFQPLSPWEKIERFSLQPVTPRSYRLVVRSCDSLFGDDVIDAEIRCSDEQAVPIRALLTRRLARARG